MKLFNFFKRKPKTHTTDKQKAVKQAMDIVFKQYAKTFKDLAQYDRDGKISR